MSNNCNHDCENCASKCEENTSCSHDCSHCSEHCSSKIEPATPLPSTKIKKIIGVLSGKGGVGKSLISSLLAIELTKRGYHVGIMDGDITGPSIAKVFDRNVELIGDNEGIVPAVSSLGIKMISVNMMLENEDVPLLWRGPMLGSIIKQFYTEVYWEDLDYLIIDMPPGTSDVAISIIQDIPVDGFVMVTSPSKLVSMIVGKAINMTKQVNKEIYGIVENMAYVKCPDCGREIDIYGEDSTAETAKKYGLEVLAKLPLDPELANLADNGKIEDYEDNYLEKLVDKITESK